MRFLSALLPGLCLLSGCFSSSEKEMQRFSGTPAEEAVMEERFRIRFREIRELKVLKAAVYPAGAPFAYEIDGKICGSEVERVRLLGTLAGWEICWVPCTKTELPGILRSGNADIGIGGFTEQQAEQLCFDGCLSRASGGKKSVILIPRQALDLKSALEKL